jgi:hypothetical protein
MEDQNTHIAAVKPNYPEGWNYAYSIDDAPAQHMSILLYNVIGRSNKDIASLVGVGTTVVAKVLGHAPYRAYLSSCRDKLFTAHWQAYRELHEAQAEVAQNLLQLIRDGNDQVRLSAIKLYADKFGLGKVEMGASASVEDEDRLPSNFDNSSIVSIRKSVGGNA